MSQDNLTANPMHQFAHFLDGLSDAIAEAKSIRRQFGSSISSEIESMLNEMEVEAKAIGDLLAAKDTQLHIAGTLRLMDETIGCISAEAMKREEDLLAETN